MEGAAMNRVRFCNPEAINREVARELRSAFERVVASGELILGREVDGFEREWAEYCQAKYCIGTGNALDALTLMLRASGIGNGDEVIVPANTYIATWLAVSAVGALPVPVEPDPLTFNISPILAQAAVTERTKAILAVHLYGRVADVKGLRGVADVRGLRLFIDAAQAHGVKGDDLGDAAAFSFYPTKNLGALGDGGAVVTNDVGLAEAVRVLRNYGSVKKNEHTMLGVNSRLDELQAAFLRAKLPYLDGWNARRMANAAYYDEAFRVTTPSSVNHLAVYAIEHREDFRKMMGNELRIETAIHYPKPPHRQAAYGVPAVEHCRPRFMSGSFMVTEALADQVVSLPVGPEISDDDARYIARSARLALEGCRIGS